MLPSLDSMLLHITVLVVSLALLANRCHAILAARALTTLVRKIRSFIPVVQTPRFRDGPASLSAHQNPPALEDGRCELHVLCTVCERVFQSSRLIRGSRFMFVSPTEHHNYHSSLEQLEHSVQLRCHFCTLVHQMLSKGSKSQIAEGSRSMLPGIRDSRSSISLLISRMASELEIEVCCDERPNPVPNAFENAYRYLSGRIFTCSPSAGRTGKLKRETEDTQSFMTTATPAHMNLARMWLDECMIKHVYCGQGRTSFAPTRLIHVGTKDGCIPIHLYQPGDHSPDPTLQYCALSHCWGGAEGILTLMSKNIAQLQECIPLTALPHTFQDAIFITRSLKRTFLWIDSLCIIQDSKDDWIKEAAIMGAVYENAACTIAAAAADNAHQGCFSRRDPLAYSSCKIAGSLSDGLFANFADGYTFDIEEVTVHSPLTKRAWVFQERLLSRRILHFGQRGIFWTCSRGQASEQNPEGEGCAADDDGVQTLFRPTDSRLRTKHWHKRPRGHVEFESLQNMSIDCLSGDVQSFDLSGDQSAAELHRHWFILVSEYSKCQLSRSEDKLVALSGIAQRVQERTGFEYLAGLWRQSLPLDLLWYNSQPKGPRPPVYRSPTWSWASVDGQITGHSVRHLPSDRVEWLVRVVGATVDTHPLDKSRTGQALDGHLTASGPLRRADLTLREPRTAIGDSHWFDIFYNDDPLGTLYPDTPPRERSLFDMYLLPFVRVSNYGTAGFKGVYFQSVRGLVLTRKSDYYERVALFDFRCRTPDFLATRWFDGCKEQTILLR